MPPPKKYIALAQKIIEIARAGFGVYSDWYNQRREYYQILEQERQVRRRRKYDEISSSQDADDNDDNLLQPLQQRRRLLEMDTRQSPELQNDNTGTPAQTTRQVSLDSSDKQGTNQREGVTNLEEEEQQEEEEDGMTMIQEPMQQRFPVGTRVRKHFPGEGWFEGCVEDARWGEDVGQQQWIYKVEFEERQQQQHDNNHDTTSSITNNNWDELVNEQELADIALPDYVHFLDPTLYSFLEFLTLWERLGAEAIEKSSTVRRANTKIETGISDTQHNAQYGRILPQATDTIFQIMRLKRSDVFLDVGHGIGNFCLQAAYCRGCEARGIEVVRDRFNVSEQFATRLEHMARQLDEDGARFRKPGIVLLRFGDLADHANHNWLARANKVVVNNFNGVFAERMVAQGAKRWHLDHYIAGLFASMREGSILVSLSDLQLGPARKEVNKWRQDNNLPPSPNASFFDVVKIELGEAGQVFSWSTSCKAPAVAFLYRRVKQDPDLRTASTLCCNIQCKHSKLGTPIPAVALNREGKAVVGTCECKMTLRSNRRIPHISAAEFLSSREYWEWGR